MSLTFEEALALSILWGCYITWRDWHRQKLYEASTREAIERQERQNIRFATYQTALADNIRILVEQQGKDDKHETTVG